MIKNPELFEKLVSDALGQDFSGWDFSYLDGRWHEDDLPWDYRQMVLERCRDIDSMLDMGTGGGEFLASLAPLPPRTCATEGYAPNVPVARARLEPLGVKVFDTESKDLLPFEDETFDLVINRHDSFAAREVYRVLKPGGRFITQQVGGRNNVRLNELLEAQEFVFSYWTLDYAVGPLEDAGFSIKIKREAFPNLTFYDVGAVVFYLKVIAWQVSDFTVERYNERLIDLHNTIQDSGELVVQSHRFYIEASK